MLPIFSSLDVPSGSGGAAYNPYVPWDPSFLERGIAMVRNNIGSAINIGIYIFLIISGIFIVAALVSSIGK